MSIKMKILILVTMSALVVAGFGSANPVGDIKFLSQAELHDIFKANSTPSHDMADGNVTEMQPAIKWLLDQKFPGQYIGGVLTGQTGTESGEWGWYVLAIKK